MTDNPEKIDGWSQSRLYIHVRLAAALFRLGKKEEAYASLDTALDLMDKIAEIPDDAEIGFNHPFFDAITVRRWDQFLLNNELYAPADYNCASQIFCNLYGWLTMYDGLWEWFAPYWEEDRYKVNLERIKKHLSPEWIEEFINNK